MRVTRRSAALFTIALAACGGGLPAWRTSAPGLESRHSDDVDLTWEITDAATSPHDEPRTRIALVLHGAVERRLEGGVIAAPCRVARRDDAWAMPEGAITGLVCCYAGNGTYFGVVRAGRDALVVRGYEQAESDGASERAPRPNDREVARVPLPPGARLRVRESEGIIGF